MVAGTAEPAGGPDLKALLEKVADGQVLRASEAEALFDSFMDGSASEIQMAGFLIGLRARGIDPAEVIAAMSSDKKADDLSANMVLLKAVGEPGLR